MNSRSSQHSPLTGTEVEAAVLLTTAGFRDEVSNLATPWVPPLESPLEPPGGATRVSFWDMGVFFREELEAGRLEAEPGEGAGTLGSKVPEELPWFAEAPEEELLEEAPCLERDPATKGDL